MTKQKQGLSFERIVIGTAFIIFGALMALFMGIAQEITEEERQNCLALTGESWQELCLSFLHSNDFFEVMRLFFAGISILGILILVRIF